MKWSHLGWPFMALFTVLMFFMRSGGDDKEELDGLHEEAQAAKVEAINAKDELAKEKIDNETNQALADAAALSDDDIIADALGEYRAGRSGRSDSGTGAEGQVSG